MDTRLKAQIRRRARFRCEYCQFPEHAAELHFQIDHIIARQHGGKNDATNLAFACFRCNSHKGTNLAGVDPQSGQVIRLFHPRQDLWREHFAWNGPKLTGLTLIGRATMGVLRINRPDAILARAALIEEGFSFVPAKRRGTQS